jgi:hypothetical protein
MTKVVEIAILVIVVIGTISAQTASHPEENFSTKVKHLTEYQKDFIQFAKLGSDSLDHEVALELSSDASTAADYVGAVHTLLEIYADLSCEEDKTRIKPVIEKEIAYYSKQMEPLITMTNAGIAATQMPGVAVESIRMRDELRDTKGTFDSIKLQ